MSEAIEQSGEAALPRPMGGGEILSAAFQLYRHHWRTLLAIAAVVVVDLRARKETLTLETLRADLRASAA